jgi:hypothetical protein
MPVSRFVQPRRCYVGQNAEKVGHGSAQMHTDRNPADVNIQGEETLSIPSQPAGGWISGNSAVTYVGRRRLHQRHIRARPSTQAVSSP